MNNKKIQEKDHVVVKFAGDSGDGIQLTGTRLTATTALEGEDVSTFPDFPAEIRAPQGSLYGVSGFQLHFGKKVFTPGDECDFLIALNPAGLVVNRDSVKEGGTIIIDSDSFTDRFMDKAGLTKEKLEEIEANFNIIKTPITTLTQKALKDLDHDPKLAQKAKNMFALGMVLNIFSYSTEFTKNFFDKKFSKKPEIAEANKAVLEGGYNYAEAIQLLPSYRIEGSVSEKGIYRNISGNTAVSLGFMSAAEKAGLKLFIGSYPITPASEILEEIASYKQLGAVSFQAEDEIAGIVSAIGASYAGNLAITATSGPGLALKTEAMGLAVMTELPLVIINIQRGGPSTGLPTKTEQTDLLASIFGRSGESPVPVFAPRTISECFDLAYFASKIALEHMTPVILLTDSFLANGSEPWKIKKIKDLQEIKTRQLKKQNKSYQPYKRDINFIREHALPGTKGLEHRIGGLEKEDVTGNVSYTPDNHEKMSLNRKQKVEKIAAKLGLLEIEGNPNADILLVGWGSTYGHLKSALIKLADENISVALLQFNYIYPLPENTGNILKKYKKILVCELNFGQFFNYLRMNFPDNDYESLSKVRGVPFKVSEIIGAVKKLLNK